MKRISIIVAIVLIATIGGVYATWNYPGTSTNIGLQQNQTITLENAVQDGAAGSYTLTHNISSINITPDGQDTKNAKLVATYSSGSAPEFILTFKPTINAGDQIEEKALASYVYFGTERTFVWGEPSTTLFTFPVGKTSPITIFTADETTEEYHWEWIQADGLFKCTITFSDITDIVNFNTTVHLPTIEDYNKFQQDVFFGGHSLQLHMHISNIAPTA